MVTSTSPNKANVALKVTMESFVDTTCSNQQIPNERGIDALMLSGFVESPNKQAMHAKTYDHVATEAAARPNESSSNNQCNTKPSSSCVSVSMASVGATARPNESSLNNQSNTKPSSSCVSDSMASVEATARPNGSSSNNQCNTKPSSSYVSVSMASVGATARSNESSSNNQTNTKPSSSCVSDSMALVEATARPNKSSLSNPNNTNPSSSCVSVSMASRNVKGSVESVLQTKGTFHRTATRSISRVGSRSSLQSKSHVSQSYGSISSKSTSAGGVKIIRKEAVLEARTVTTSQRHTLEKQQLMLRHQRDEEERIQKIETKREEIARKGRIEEEKLERECKSMVEIWRQIKQREIDELNVRHQREHFEISSELEEIRAKRKVRDSKLIMAAASGRNNENAQNKILHQSVESQNNVLLNLIPKSVPTTNPVNIAPDLIDFDSPCLSGQSDSCSMPDLIDFDSPCLVGKSEPNIMCESEMISQTVFPLLPSINAEASELASENNIIDINNSVIKVCYRQRPQPSLVALTVPPGSPGIACEMCSEIIDSVNTKLGVSTDILRNFTIQVNTSARLTDEGLEKLEWSMSLKHELTKHDRQKFCAVKMHVIATGQTTSYKLKYLVIDNG